MSDVTLRVHALLLLAIAACATSKAKVSEEPKPKEGPKAASASGAPVTEVRPIVDEFHGVKVSDPYRWLETWDDPKVRAWSQAQNVHARAVLDHLPGVETIRGRVAEIFRYESIRHYALQVRGQKLFAEKRHPPKQQALLVVMPLGKMTEERVLLDPNVLDPSGATSIDWFRP